MIDEEELRSLSAQRDEAKAARCACRPLQSAAWESVTDERWPAVVHRVGTLRAPDVDEPTFEEYHPHGTRYDSPDAPIALGWFPYNRCDVHACERCRSVFLRYTEYGGYYVDHRVRLVEPGLVVSPPAN